VPNNPKAIENLRPPKKGEVRNPTGRNGFSNEFRTMLAKTATEQDFVDITNKILELAKKGNVDAIKYVLDKTYPKVDKPIDVNLTVDDVRNKLIKRITGNE
jgi:hypothetical protein